MDISQLRFLIVDDSHMIREVIEKLLHGLGASRIDKVGDGQQALFKIRRANDDKDPYHLVTLDWEMPVMSGLELLKIVRADAALKDLRVLMVSTKSDADHLRQLAPYTPSGFVVKPFTSELFQERVLALLQAAQG